MSSKLLKLYQNPKYEMMLNLIFRPYYFQIRLLSSFIDISAGSTYFSLTGSVT